MLEVAVIGAGAAGLVASRNLLRHGLKPCIFEASKVLGGCWNQDSTSNSAYKMWDSLTPNLSKYTCVFSDQPWPDTTPTFPSRHQLQQYLIDYGTTTSIDNDNAIDPACFRFGCTVTHVQRSNVDNGQDTAAADANQDAFTQPFQVMWNDPEGISQTQEFDGVIVATGFFATPFLPEGLQSLPLLQEETSYDNSPPTPSIIIHSSQYRSPSDFTNQTVAVVGASFSACEIAADVRKQAAKVIHIMPSAPYVLPRYVPSSTGGGAFAPLDVVLYQRQQDAPQIPATLQMTPEQAQAKHAFLKQLAGRKQSALQSQFGFPPPLDTSQPPFVAISDDYLDLVVDGTIEVVPGRVEKATLDDTNKKKVQLEVLQKETASSQSTTTLKDIDRVICCTGYQSQLDFLEPSILKTLQYDASDRYAPLTLCHDAVHPDIPGLGFVGMYRGPYFGVMELQAKTVAALMSSHLKPSADQMAVALEESKTIRQASSKAQFPRHDYIGFMDTLAEPLGLVPKGIYGAKGTMVSPLFYQPNNDDLMDKSRQATEQELQRGGSANMAKVALRALVGKWEFERSITQMNDPSAPPQRVTGVIDFSHIVPSASSSDDDSTKPPQQWNAVLYNENGIFHVAGKELEVFRQYEYEYKDNGILEIYFVEFGKRAHLFLSLQFLPERSQNGRWTATSDHLCIKDLYKGEFQIQLDGISATKVSMTYRVKGPNKDYESVTQLLPHY